MAILDAVRAGEDLDGRYRILRRLGAGGMGEVYLAEHLVLGRREAIKVIKGRFARSEDYLSRFCREARATHRVRHPHIVHVYDFGRLADGRLYLTMEFADGPNLEELLQSSGALAIGRALRVLGQLVAAVSYAHSKGVIHRDLKPENLVLTGRDHLKVLDFGVAKILDGGGESAAISRDGELFGTPAYIAPEQIQGVRDDPRSDIYAVGCIAYALVSGAPPFAGGPIQVLQSHLHERPRRPSLARGPASEQREPRALPEALDDCILRCLAKDPGERYQSGAELATALVALSLGETAPAGASSRMAARSRMAPSTVPGTAPSAASLFRPSTAEESIWRCLRALGEAICDIGGAEPELVVLVAELEQVERSLDEVRGELEALGARAGELGEAARGREAALQFALAELRLPRSAAFRVGRTLGGPDVVAPAEGVRRAVEVLEARLAAQTAEVVAALREVGESEATGSSRGEALVAEHRELYRQLDDRIEASRLYYSSRPDMSRLFLELDGARREAEGPLT